MRRFTAAPFGRLGGQNLFTYKMEIIPAASSEWIVRLYPDNRRAGDIALAGTGAETIPPPVSLKTERYQPKQWQARSLTNQIAIASTAGFQRDESLWAHPPVSPDTQTASGLSGFTRATGERAALPLPRQDQKPSLPSVPLNTKRYQPKQRQALSRTNSLAAATTMGFQRDESLWPYPRIL